MTEMPPLAIGIFPEPFLRLARWDVYDNWPGHTCGAGRTHARGNSGSIGMNLTKPRSIGRVPSRPSRRRRIMAYSVSSWSRAVFFLFALAVSFSSALAEPRSGKHPFQRVLKNLHAAGAMTRWLADPKNSARIGAMSMRPTMLNVPPTHEPNAAMNSFDKTCM